MACRLSRLPSLRALLTSAADCIVPSRATAAIAAEDFRIETKIFVGDEEKPVSKTTTLFLDGVVYDFLAKPEQTPCSANRAAASRAASSCSIRQQRMQNGTLDRATGRRDEQAAQLGRRGRTIRSCNLPPIRSSRNRSSRDSGKLVLASHLENYTVDTRPAEHPEALAEYREFLDWYTQLNTLLQAARRRSRGCTERRARAAQGRAAQGRADPRRREGTAPRRARIHLAAVARRSASGSTTSARRWPAIARWRTRSFCGTRGRKHRPEVNAQSMTMSDGHTTYALFYRLTRVRESSGRSPHRLHTER